MEPTLFSGQIVVFCSFVKPQVGSVIQFQHDDLDKVKRVNHMEKESLFVLGDNQEQSTDSRNWGAININQVQGVLLWPRVRQRF